VNFVLVLTRHINEKIIIGDNIEITVVDIQGDQVSLGIKAPKEISIHRKEIYEAIQAENRRAAPIGAGEPEQDKPVIEKRAEGGGWGRRGEITLDKSQ
jgi:carbon storage regulator